MSNLVSSAAPFITAHAKSQLPDAVVQLLQSMIALELAVETLRGRESLSSEVKRDTKMIGEVGKRIVSAIVAARLQRPGELHILAKAYVVVTQESVVEWTEEIYKLRRISSPQSLTLRSATAAQIQAFVASVQVLEEMLEIRNGVAQVILDPAHRLGLSDARPSFVSRTQDSVPSLADYSVKDLPQLSSARAVYEGLKVVVQGLANMTDGAPWPWKAIPQTLLQFAAMVERSLSQPKRIQGLVDKIVQRIGFLLSVSRSGDGNNMELDSYIEAFLAFVRDVHRIIIRLRMVEKVHPIKTFPLTDYIEGLIADEAGKMQVAFQELQTRFIVHTAYTAQSIDASVSVIQGDTSRTLATVTEALAMISQIHAAVTSSNTTQTYQMSIRPCGVPENVSPNPPSGIPARAKLSPQPVFFRTGQPKPQPSTLSSSKQRSDIPATPESESTQDTGTDSSTTELLIITCIDAQLNTRRAFGFAEGHVLMIRNAGGRAKDAIPHVLQSLSGSVPRRIVVVHHTECGMVLSKPQVHAADTEKRATLTPSDSIKQAVCEDVKLLEEHSQLKGIHVAGCILDASGTVYPEGMYSSDIGHIRLARLASQRRVQASGSPTNSLLADGGDAASNAKKPRICSMPSYKLAAAERSEHELSAGPPISNDATETNSSAKELLFITCMEVALDTEKVFGRFEGDVKVIRNVGGGAKNALPHILTWQSRFKTGEIAVVHHNECSIVGFNGTDPVFRAKPDHTKQTDLPEDFIEHSLERDVTFLKELPALKEMVITGWILHTSGEVTLKI